MINETYKQMLYRLFTQDEVYNHNINGTNDKYSLDANCIRAVFVAHQNMLSGLPNNVPGESLKTYINTRLRKQIHIRLLNMIDMSSFNR